MKKICVMMIAACMLAVSTANTADASLITKRIDGVKKIANLVSKTADSAGKIVWNNKGAIAVGTVATVALTNPKAATAAVTGTADVAYGVVTNGKTADTVAPRTNARPSTTGGSIIPALLFFLAFVGIGIVIGTYLRRRSGVFRVAVPLLIVGLLLCFGATSEASMLGSFPDIQCTASPSLIPNPFINFVMLVLTLASIFL